MLCNFLVFIRSLKFILNKQNYYLTIIYIYIYIYIYIMLFSSALPGNY
ncbi:MAG: hypothetical protein N7Q72_02365 [Spiroplasma sp. Tabriz.8]|nr:hypothetical protein [Spiroplasma sp. Tabriz.8]